MKKLILAVILSITMINPCYAMTAHEQAMSYIQHDKSPTKIGETVKTLGGAKLVETTGYCQGTVGSHGDKMREGYVAYTTDSYGYAMEIYEAVPTDAGYEVGDFIGLYEVKDVGYGRSLGYGTSEVRKDRKYAGTIEKGLSVDTYFPTLDECKKWMKRTNGVIFIRLIPAKG